jgi:hypothetical protein
VNQPSSFFLLPSSSAPSASLREPNFLPLKP